MDYKRSSIGSSSDDPPLSRLFIVGPKNLTEDDFRRNFSEFGRIEEIYLVNDKNTGDYKGITYIKYTKTSEAANALEAMNGTLMSNTTRRIKVMIAASREQGSKRETNEEEKMQRLFIVCPKCMSEDDLLDHFRQFGDVDYVNIIKDKQTRESKGIAYVKYFKFSHAAKAFEECDRKYKAVFAEPKNSEPIPKRGESRDFFNTLPSNIMPINSRNNTFNNFPMNVPPSISGPSGINEVYTKLTVISSADINENQLWKLFDIVPGLDYCQVRYQEGVRPTRAIGEVVYKSPQWAAYAKEKLHGFEYPPGFRLIVKPLPDSGVSPRQKPEQRQDLMHIAETIAHASSIIQAAGLNPSTLLNLKEFSEQNSQLKCSVSLPDPQPLAGVDDECLARCFIVCTTPLANTVLRDLFCRFGNLIEAYLLNNKNCGYARYSDRSSCEQAIKTLHGAEVNGVRLKVLVAEEQRKRLKTEIDYCELGLGQKKRCR